MNALASVKRDVVTRKAVLYKSVQHTDFPQGNQQNRTSRWNYPGAYHRKIKRDSDSSNERNRKKKDPRRLKTYVFMFSE